jgi:hypothetical protein
MSMKGGKRRKEEENNGGASIPFYTPEGVL